MAAKAQTSHEDFTCALALDVCKKGGRINISTITLIFFCFFMYQNMLGEAGSLKMT
jgi:hypothetical protein